ncbi:MAG: NAD(P)/FAD-dependent oxidoreductase [Burkholderiales bacterium]
MGAGPAGLTAALELLRRTGVKPIVVEASDAFGGLSRTVVHRGFRMDLGGHRFFSKSDWVMDWWQEILPIDTATLPEGGAATLSYQSRQREWRPAAGAPPRDPERVMLVRNRLSRIYHRGRFFDYPIRLDINTVRNLGFLRSARAGLSYIAAHIVPRRPEVTLEDFLINRFGRELYREFFESYTEKVWGVPCTRISADWGAQRIKGLSLKRAITHALRSGISQALGRPSEAKHTSLIERFLYPRLGPGQMWEEVARRVREGGGTIVTGARAERLRLSDGRVTGVDVRRADGTVATYACDYAISSIPVKELVESAEPPAPDGVRAIAERLPYRDFVTVGLAARRTRIGREAPGVPGPRLPPDNWIYVQEPDVRIGRIQVFNNWSPALVPDASVAWLGLEYFCTEGDDLWSMTDADLIAFGVRELAKIGIVDPADVVDGVVVRVPKAYPAYTGAYERFDVVRAWLDAIPNLFPVGRNGMHRYNNQDHSMLTARAAVDAIAAGRTDKAALWSINVDDDYLEEK